MQIIIKGTDTDARGNAELNDARYHLADLYRQGNGVKRNPDEAIRLFRKAAENNHAEAQNRLGIAYAFGESVEQNEAEAKKWFRRAADAGSSEALANLNDMEKSDRNKIPAQTERTTRKTPAYETGEAIGSILKFMKWQSEPQDSSGNSGGAAISSDEADKEYHSCVSMMQKRIARCSAGMGECYLTGCEVDTYCNKGGSFCSNQIDAFGSLNDVYYCDTKKRRNIEKTQQMVIDNVCRRQ